MGHGAMKWKFGERGEGWVIAQIVVLLAAAVAPRRGTWPGGWQRAGKVVGVPVALAGAGLTVAGGRALGTNLTALPRPKDDGALVQDGVYGVMRHPVYSGMILSTVGVGLLTGNTARTLLGLALTLLLDAKARREEVWLTEKFPAYPAYRRAVKKLIPFVY